MMHYGMNMMHGVGSMDAQQHPNLARTNASVTTKQQQQQQEAHIRKPMNAFMLWSRAQRRKVASEHPNMPNREISKRLGADWKLLTSDEQKIFFDEAKLLREQHKRDHPNYKYTSEHIRRPMNAFMLWAQAQRRKVASEHPNMPNREISKHLGAGWKLLTSDEQKVFSDEAKLLREQHKRDHPNYKNTSEHIRSPMNAFMLWAQAQRRKVASEHPNMPNTEISKHLGAEWKLLTSDEQKIFIDEATLLREQHKRDHPDCTYRRRFKPKPPRNL